MTLKQVIAMIVGSLAGGWVRELLLWLGLDQTLAAVSGVVTSSMVTTAIAAR
ncbi:hypothetical protein [Fodinicola acaciae]|uniref:hypothetical protein n=1 Tax=Fodinicola acaciae TaxID=2681555 RepID=UPI0013D00FDD|nr:hypothetical protein [Fodinicola acaciae]